MNKFCLFFTIFFVTSFFEICAEKSSLNSILATVNGEAITLLDLMMETKSREERIFSVYSGFAPSEEIEKTRQNTLEELIADKLILAEFKKRGYKVPSQMVERMLDSVATELADGDRRKLSELAEKNKTSFEELRKKAEDRAAIELMINEFCSRHINVSPKEINERIATLKPQKNPSPKLELLVIFIEKDREGKNEKSELIKKIQKDLKQHNKNIFMTLAKLYSESHSAQKGGYLGWIEKEKLRPEFAEAIENLEPGKASDLIETPEGSYFIFLSAIDKNDEDKISPSRFDEIKELILEEKISEAKKNFVEKLRKNAIIRYFY